MRRQHNFLSAALLLLAPALAATARIFLDAPDVKDVLDRGVTYGPQLGVKTAAVSLELCNGPTVALGFVVEVLPSSEPCGYGNVTLDGKSLEQTSDGFSTGSGIVELDGRRVLASWSLNCMEREGRIQDTQLLKFFINSVDGFDQGHVGFEALFSQTDSATIISILGKGTRLKAIPISNLKGEIDPNLDEKFKIQNKMVMLERMRRQVIELQEMIFENEQVLAKHIASEFKDVDENVTRCDGIKCVLSIAFDKVRHTANQVYEKIRGDAKIVHLKLEGLHRRPGHFNCSRPDRPSHPDHPSPPDRPRHPDHGKDHGKPHQSLQPQPPHQGPLDDSTIPPYTDSRLPPPSQHIEAPLLRVEDGSPRHMRPFGHNDNGGQKGPAGSPPRSHRHGIGKAIGVIKFTVIGFLVAVLLITIHRRGCSSRDQVSRHERREERRRRRAYRRAARMQAISRFCSRFSTNQPHLEGVEPRERLLSNAENGINATMTEEIAQFRNAVGIVGDIIAAEEGRSLHALSASIGREESPSMRDFEIGSELGNGEELPAYEDSNTSEMSSSVADGFRYTPGSSDCSPSHSVSGNVSDILGPDSK